MDVTYDVTGVSHTQEHVPLIAATTIYTANDVARARSSDGRWAAVQVTETGTGLIIATYADGTQRHGDMPVIVRCGQCPEAIHFEGNGYGAGDGYVHTGTGNRWGPDGPVTRDSHSACPVPQCPKCQSLDYGTEQTMYGILSRCGDCRYEFYYSLGD